MNENELNQRRIGFMKAVNLLSKDADPQLRDTILDSLGAFGNDLHREIESEEPDDGAKSLPINPGPRGSHWDPIQQTCVADIIDS
jgi:hypothetical protein